MLDGETLYKSLSIGELALRVSALVKRMHRVEKDLSVDPSDLNALQQLLVKNPIEAFVSARGVAGAPYFKFDGETFAFEFEIVDPIAASALLREILDWRLAQYLSRGMIAEVICRV